MEWFLAVSLTDRLGTLDIQIHDHRILPASDDDGFAGDIPTGIEFLMWDIGRHVNEVPRTGLITELYPIAPAHARTTSDDVKHRLQFAMMVGTRSGVRLNDYGTGPQLARASTGVSNGGSSGHSRGLRRVRVQLTRVDDLYSMFFPVQCLSPYVVLRYERSIPAPSFGYKYAWREGLNVAGLFCRSAVLPNPRRKAADLQNPSALRSLDIAACPL